MTKVMISLPTSLLIFLAIEQMDMGRDVTAFRERFKAYKNGKSVSEIYDAGLPKYAGGYTPSPEFVDRVIKEEGFLTSPQDIGDGKRTVGSGLTGQKWLSQYDKAGVWTKEMNRVAVAEELANADKYLRTVFPEYDSYPEGVREVLQDIQYNTGKVNMKYSPKFVTAVRNKNWGEARRQMDWGNTDPKFGKGLRARNARRQALWDKALGYDARPAIQQPVSTAVRPVIKEEQVVPAYDPTISPYISGKPMLKLRPRIQLPNLIELMEDSEWEPGFPGLKNGKLPRYWKGTSGWNEDESTQKAEQWADDWQFRLTPAARSKVVQKWNATGNKPEPESAEQYTQRRMKETEWKKPSGRKMLEMAPTAVDFVPGAGDVKQGLEAVNAAINKDYLTAGILGSLLIAPSAAAKLIKKYVNKANDLAPIVNDIAKNPHLPDELDAWTSMMEHRNYKDRKAERMFEQNLPDLIAMEDEWIKSGAKGNRPKLWDYNNWNAMDNEQKFSTLFEKKIDPEFNQEYYVIRPGYKDFVELESISTTPYGYTFHGDIDAPDVGIYGNIPDEIKKQKLPIIHDESYLGQILGLKPIPATYKFTKPIKPVERVNWDEYRNQLKEKILDDWNSDGPLRSHLQRSGITNPVVLLDYMLSPEQAWKQSLSKPGFDIGQAFFNANLKNDIMRDPVFFEGFQESLNKVLKRYGEAPMNIDKSRSILTTSEIRDQIMGHTNRNRKKSDRIFSSAFNDVLKRNPDAAKQFYTELDKTYNNAFASRAKGTMYISPQRETFGRTVSHEFGHLEDLPSYYKKDKSIPGVVESTQTSLSPSANTPLFKKAFDLSKVDSSTERYFASGGDDATEMAQRATQIADYLKLKKGEPITPEKLKYAMENYVKDTGMDNNMTEFFSTIKDIKAAAKWMSAFHKAIIPFGVSGTVAYKTLKPRKENK